MTIWNHGEIGSLRYRTFNNRRYISREDVGKVPNGMKVYTVYESNDRRTTLDLTEANSWLDRAAQLINPSRQPVDNTQPGSQTTILNMNWMDRAAMSIADKYFFNYTEHHTGPEFPITTPPGANTNWVNDQFYLASGAPETKIAFFEDQLTAIYLNDTGETSVDYATLQAYWNSVTSLKVVWAYFPSFTDSPTYIGAYGVTSESIQASNRSKGENFTGIKIGGIDTGVTGATLVDGGIQYNHNTYEPDSTPWTYSWASGYTGDPSELRLFYSDNQEFDIPIPAGNTTWLRNATSLQSGWGTNNFSAMAYYNLDIEYPILSTSFGGAEETAYYYVTGIIPILVGYTRS